MKVICKEFKTLLTSLLDKLFLSAFAYLLCQSLHQSFFKTTFNDFLRIAHPVLFICKQFSFLCGSSFNHSRITGLKGKGEDISLTPHYHFHPVHRHLDISRAITAESSPLHIGSSQIRTGNLWFPSVSC